MKEVALLFPAMERKSILEKNLIYNAVAVGNNFEMRCLMVYWKEYVEKDLNVTCNLCYGRVLRNFQQLQPVFIELEKQEALLNDA